MAHSGRIAAERPRRRGGGAEYEFVAVNDSDAATQDSAGITGAQDGGARLSVDRRCVARADADDRSNAAIRGGSRIQDCSGSRIATSASRTKTAGSRSRRACPCRQHGSHAHRNDGRHY